VNLPDLLDPSSTHAEVQRQLGQQDVIQFLRNAALTARGE